jgi:uncharacterized membrane protein
VLGAYANSVERNRLAGANWVLKHSPIWRDAAQMLENSRVRPGSSFASRPGMEQTLSGNDGGESNGSPWREGLRVRSQRRAVGLGLLSVGLGTAQLFFPGQIASLIGVRNRTTSRLAMRALGLRELVTGIGLIINPRSGSWALARGAGDALDLALLHQKLGHAEGGRARIAATAAAVVGVAAMDVVSAAGLSRNRTVQKLVGPIHVTRAVTIRRPPADVYAFFRNLENLPRVMQHLESVRIVNGHSIWRAKAPAGLSIEWKAEIVQDRPNEVLACFAAAPRDRGTELLVELKYDPPAGAIGAAMAKLFGEEPSLQIASDLRRVKQVLETGEVVHSDETFRRGGPARPSTAQSSEEKGES